MLFNDYEHSSDLVHIIYILSTVACVYMCKSVNQSNYNYSLKFTPKIQLIYFISSATVEAPLLATGG